MYFVFCYALCIIFRNVTTACNFSVSQLWLATSAHRELDSKLRTRSSCHNLQDKVRFPLWKDSHARVKNNRILVSYNQAEVFCSHVNICSFYYSLSDCEPLCACWQYLCFLQCSIASFNSSWYLIFLLCFPLQWHRCCCAVLYYALFDTTVCMAKTSS